MRPELEQLARIDSYVNKTMSAAESAVFEKEMAQDPAMKEAVETQSLMITAVNRKALLAQVLAAAPAATMPTPNNGPSLLSKFKWPIILSSMVIGALVTYFAMGKSNNTATNNFNAIASNLRTPKGEYSFGSSIKPLAMSDDSANDNVNDIRPIATAFENTARKNFGGLETWVRPDLQKITIDPKEEQLIECENGTVIFIPENAFEDAQGNTVADPVTLEIIEALTLDKMVAYNLATMNGTNALKSGGMIYVQPKLNGKNLNLVEGKSLHIEVPTDNYDAEMQVWTGVPDGNGNLNWENPQPIENYLIPTDMSALDFLPNGFREEVAATLPFKGYTTSSQELEDSLYYAMSAHISQNENQPFELPIRIESKKEVAPSGSHRKKVKTRSGKRYGLEKVKGLGAIQFMNLDMSKKYQATFTLDGQEYTTHVTSDTIQTDLLGLVNVKITTPGCDPFVLENVEISDDVITLLNCKEWKCSGVKPVTKIASLEVQKCYINPSSVYAIRQSEFENTFIATKEFQERLQALHKIENAQPLFELYVQQLDTDLHVIDAQVAEKLSGVNQTIFEDFAAQKLTNVKPNGQGYDKLRKLYSTRAKEQQQKVRKAQEEYNKKSLAELQEIRSEMAQLESDFRKRQQKVRAKYGRGNRNVGVSPPRTASSSMRNTQALNQMQNATPQVGQQASYKVNWFGTGWMNIDAFLHELSKGKEQVPINVADHQGMKIYQSVNSLNTLLSLNETEDGYNAQFPTSQSTTFEKSLTLGVRRSKGQLQVAAQFFNPYATSIVELSDWETVSESEFKRRLKELYPGGQRMLKAMRDQEKRIREAEARKQRAELQRKKMESELNAVQQEFQENNAALEAKTEAIRMRQAAERSYVQHLEDFINPCSARFKSKNETGPVSIDEIVAYPDVQAEFPGGSVEFMRWISSNVQYPQQAQKEDIQGKVYVRFVVEPDGSASNVKITNSDPKTKLIEAEAVRLVQGMPPWKSGEVNGIRVRSIVSVPITFTLD